MISHWHDSARALFEKNPGLAGRILRDLLKTDLPPGTQCTLLTPLCGDDPYEDEPRADDDGDDFDGENELAGHQPGALSGEPIPELIILAGPASDPVRAVIVELRPDQDDAARGRWPLFAATVWLAHGCPVDILVICPNVRIASWANRPIATALDGYVCWPTVLQLEDLGAIVT